MKYTIGIDEAGRGPLAGPVAVAAAKISPEFDKKFFNDIKDSKKLSAEERELWFSMALEEKKKGNLDYAVVLISETTIDKHGIAYAVRLGIKRCLEKLRVPEEECQIFLDGGIKAPSKFPHQLTVIKGDEKIPVVSLASIIAKVTRDRWMIKKSRKFPEFDFHIHKGYATLMHRLALAKHGPTILHRKSFLKNFPHFQS